jgi:hypothetical protein
LLGWILTLGSVADYFQDSAESGESTILSHKNEGKDDFLTEIMTCDDSSSKAKINSRILSHCFSTPNHQIDYALEPQAYAG